MKEEKKPIKVVELFAGVGGFRLGLEGYARRSASSRYKKRLVSPYEVVWSNQFEPNSSVQHASDVYRFRWPGSNHSNKDINKIANAESLDEIPPHHMIVGGFPCQDYSVANTLKRAGGIIGKKGVLWWDIHTILDRLQREGRPTQYLMLENVDRLLKSPAKQRGRDFAIMLSSLSTLGYAVEWRVINAAEYGMPQRRRRVFILAYHRDSPIFAKMQRSNPDDWMTATGPFARAFPVADLGATGLERGILSDDPHEITLRFNLHKEKAASPFRSAGRMVELEYASARVVPPVLGVDALSRAALGQFLENGSVPREYFVDEALVIDEKRGWAYHKGPKAKTREDKETGHIYQWSEGGMSLHDDVTRPARTVITSEGGPSPSRSKHLILTPTGEYRRLTPMELERVSMFPDNHTKWGLGANGEPYEITPGKRAFFIGNALVAGVVERLGIALAQEIGGELGVPVSHNG